MHEKGQKWCWSTPHTEQLNVEKKQEEDESQKKNYIWARKKGKKTTKELLFKSNLSFMMIHFVVEFLKSCHFYKVTVINPMIIKAQRVCGGILLKIKSKCKYRRATEGCWVERNNKIAKPSKCDYQLLHSPWCWVRRFCWEMGGLPDWGQVRVVRGLQFCLAHCRGCGVGLNYPGAACLIWPGTFGDRPKAE